MYVLHTRETWGVFNPTGAKCHFPTQGQIL